MTATLDLQTLQVYRFIRDYIRTNGMPPTQREIAEGVYMATTTMVIHLTRLEMRGWLFRDYNIPRSIRFGDLAPDDETFDKLWQSAIERDEQTS